MSRAQSELHERESAYANGQAPEWSVDFAAAITTLN
jgi:hypothetical protein